MRALTSSMVSQFKGRLEDCRNVRRWNPTPEGMICPWSILSYAWLPSNLEPNSSAPLCAPGHDTLPHLRPKNNRAKQPWAKTSETASQIKSWLLYIDAPGEMQIKSTWLFQLPQLECRSLGKQMLVKPWVKKRAFAPCQRGWEKVQPLCKSAWKFLKKLKTSCDPAMSPLAHTGRESKSAYNRDVHTSVYYCVVHQGWRTKSA